MLIDVYYLLPHDLTCFKYNIYNQYTSFRVTCISTAMYLFSLGDEIHFSSLSSNSAS